MKSVAIFGTGSALKDFLSVLPEDVSVVGLGDNDVAKRGQYIEGHLVHSPRDFARLDCTRFVITSRAVDDIRAQLESLGVPSQNISAYYPSYSQSLGIVINRDIVDLNRSLGLGLPVAGLATMYLWPNASSNEVEVASDFVRCQSFRLAAETIYNRGIAGNIAELGVFQGEQAALLNRLFPDRMLHLFDTFEGFSEMDLDAEQQGGFSGAATSDFTNTSVELVRSKLEHPEKAVIHAGFFPGTAEGVEDLFAFVSLDVDLHDPTFAGLNYFYPRLAPGGYIFVHDYNNRRYLGVRHAVDRFLAETEATALPLPDFAGSIVISRPGNP